MEKEEDKNENGLGRRKFLRFGIGFMGGVGLISALGGVSKISKSKSNMVKMLTPDGKLVEIDASHLSKSVINEKASNDDILKWMDKKSN